MTDYSAVIAQINAAQSVATIQSIVDGYSAAATGVTEAIEDKLQSLHMAQGLSEPEANSAMQREF